MMMVSWLLGCLVAWLLGVLISLDLGVWFFELLLLLPLMIGLPFRSPHSHEHFAVDVCRTLLVPEQEVGGEEGNHVQASSCRSTLLPFLNC